MAEWSSFADFYSFRGLTQGYLLSPCLFPLVADALLLLLNVVSSGGGIQDFRLCTRAPNSSDLLFANESVLFSKENCVQFLFIQMILDLYEESI